MSIQTNTPKINSYFSTNQRTCEIKLEAEEQNISKLFREAIKHHVTYFAIAGIAFGFGFNIIVKEASRIETMITKVFGLCLFGICLGCASVPALCFKPYNEWLKKNTDTNKVPLTGQELRISNLCKQAIGHIIYTTITGMVYGVSLKTEGTPTQKQIIENAFLGGYLGFFYACFSTPALYYKTYYNLLKITVQEMTISKLFEQSTENPFFSIGVGSTTGVVISLIDLKKGFSRPERSMILFSLASLSANHFLLPALGYKLHGHKKDIKSNTIPLSAQDKSLSKLFQNALRDLGYSLAIGGLYGLMGLHFKNTSDPNIIISGLLGSLLGLCVYYILAILQMKLSLNRTLPEYYNQLKIRIKIKTSTLLEKFQLNRQTTINAPSKKYVFLDSNYHNSNISLYIKEKNVSKLFQQEIRRVAKFVIMGAVVGGIIGVLSGSEKNNIRAQMIETCALALSIIGFVIGCMAASLSSYRNYKNWLKTHIETETFLEFERHHMNHSALQKFIDQTTQQIMLDPVHPPSSKLIYDRSTLSAKKNENGCVMDITDNSVFHIDQVQSIPELLEEMKAVYIKLLKNESQIKDDEISSSVQDGLKALASDLEIQVKKTINREITTLQGLSISNVINLKEFCERINALTAKMNPQIEFNLAQSGNK